MPLLALYNVYYTLLTYTARPLAITVHSLHVYPYWCLRGESFATLRQLLRPKIGFYNTLDYTRIVPDNGSIVWVTTFSSVECCITPGDPKYTEPGVNYNEPMSEQSMSYLRVYLTVYPVICVSAGCADGVDAWDIRTVAGEVTTDKFLPRLTEEERNIK